MLLKQAQKDADPLCDRLESICPAIADLQPLETGLWELFKLSGPLDPVTLLKHCEGSVPSEMSGDDDYGKQNREWLQDLDRLHRLRKEKSDILTDLAEKHGYNLCPPASPQGRRMPSLVCLPLHFAFIVSLVTKYAILAGDCQTPECMGRPDWHQPVSKH